MLLIAPDTSSDTFSVATNYSTVGSDSFFSLMIKLPGAILVMGVSGAAPATLESPYGQMLLGSLTAAVNYG
jgi:hypothetical protein